MSTRLGTLPEMTKPTTIGFSVPPVRASDEIFITRRSLEGISSVDEAKALAALKEGIKKDGKEVKKSFASELSDADLKALIGYVRGLKQAARAPTIIGSSQRQASLPAVRFHS